MSAQRTARRESDDHGPRRRRRLHGRPASTADSSTAWTGSRSSVRRTPATRPSLRRPSFVPIWCCSTCICPTCSALDLIARLRAVRPDVDILVITAAREAEAVRGAVRYGVVNYLLKPFGFEELRDPPAAVRPPPGERARPGGLRPGRRRPGPRPRRARPVNRAAEGAQPGDRRTGRPRAPGRPTATCPPPNAPSRVGISRVSARRYLEYFADTRPGRGDPALRRRRPPRTPLQLANVGAPLRAGQDQPACGTAKCCR